MPLQPKAQLTSVSGFKGRLAPLEGRVAVQALVDFTTAAANIDVAPAYLFDFSQYTQNGAFDLARSVLINNSQNPSQVIVSVSKTPMKFPVPAYSVALLPTMAEPGSQITLYSIGGASELTEVMFFNTQEAPYCYAGFAPGPSGQQVQVQPGVAVGITNRNTALAAGVAANVFPASSTARMIRFRNMGQSVAFYNVGAAATGAFPADHQLDPGDEWITLPYQTTEAISFFCAAVCDIEAEEISFL